MARHRAQWCARCLRRLSIEPGFGLVDDRPGSKTLARWCALGGRSQQAHDPVDHNPAEPMLDLSGIVFDRNPVAVLDTPLWPWQGHDAPGSELDNLYSFMRPAT